MSTNPKQIQYNLELVARAEERRQRIKELYEVAGLTIREIADRESLTRQRVHAILQKAHYTRRKKSNPIAERGATDVS